VECQSCGLQGPSFSLIVWNDDGEQIGTRDAALEAITAWNTRPEDRTASTDELVAENAALREAVHILSAAIGEWARPTGANGMVPAGDSHPLCVAASEARALLNKHREAMS
jgi:hypothetical protein